MTTDWRAQALCLDRDPLWDMDPSNGTDKPDIVEYVTNICHACPVETICGVENMAETHGIFGGMTPTERSRARNSHSTRPDACGSSVGYYRHKTAGEIACQPCKDARQQAQRDRERRHARETRNAELVAAS